MTKRSTEHATFDIERFYDASPSRVFQAWADPKSKAQWFGPINTPGALALDFQIGGREHFKEELPDGRIFAYDGHYHDIVADERFIFDYTIDFDTTRISASLVTVEIATKGPRTRLLYTEQAVYLDGEDTPADRERGTIVEIDRLEAFLSS